MLIVGLFVSGFFVPGTTGNAVSVPLSGVNQLMPVLSSDCTNPVAASSHENHPFYRMLLE